MKLCRFKVPCCAVLWTFAVTVMTMALVQHSVDLADAALLAGVIACVPSGWLIIDHVAQRTKKEIVYSVCEAIGYAEAAGRISHLR